MVKGLLCTEKYVFELDTHHFYSMDSLDDKPLMDLDKWLELDWEYFTFGKDGEGFMDD